MRTAAQTILAASTIYFLNTAQTVIGSGFRPFSIREKCEGVARFVARHDHFLSRNHPVSGRNFG